MSLTKSAALAASVTLFAAGSGNAAIVEFDTSGLFMSDVFGGTGCCFTPSGKFKLDTVTETLFDVSVTTIYGTYDSGAFDPTFPAFGLFDGTTDLVLDISDFDYATILSDIAGATAGDMFFYGANPSEYINSTGTPYSEPVDPTLYMTVIDPTDTPPPPPTVPLPAGLPLLLAGLGGFAFLRRKG